MTSSGNVCISKHYPECVCAQMFVSISYKTHTALSSLEEWKKRRNYIRTTMRMPVFLQTCFSQVFPPAFSLSSVMDPHLEFGHKAGELLVPVVERGCRRDDQEWPPDVVSLCRETEKKIHRQAPQQVVFVGAPNNRKPWRNTAWIFLSWIFNTEKLPFPLNSTFSPFGAMRGRDLKSWQISYSQQRNKSYDSFNKLFQHLEKDRNQGLF